MPATAGPTQLLQKLYLRFLCVSQETERIHDGIQLPSPHHTFHVL